MAGGHLEPADDVSGSDTDTRAPDDGGDAPIDAAMGEAAFHTVDRTQSGDSVWDLSRSSIDISSDTSLNLRHSLIAAAAWQRSIGKSTSSIVPGAANATTTSVIPMPTAATGAGGPTSSAPNSPGAAKRARGRWKRAGLEIGLEPKLMGIDTSSIAQTRWKMATNVIAAQVHKSLSLSITDSSAV